MVKLRRQASQYYLRIPYYLNEEYYLLEMTHLVGAVNKVCSLAKEGVDTSGNDDSVKLTLLAGGT